MKKITRINKAAIKSAKLFFGTLLLLSSAFALAQSSKPVVAVGTFESSFKDFDTRNIQTAIETALSKMQKFSLMERGRLDQLMAEQGLGENGIVSGSGGVGGFDGVDYLIYGRVTQLGLEAKNLLIISACEAQFGLDIRVVDVKSGEIRLSENISADDQVNTASAEENPCRGIGISAFDNLTAKTARDLAEKLTQALFPVKLAKVSSEEVYLNYGEGFLKNGEILKVVSLGEGFEDPDTGEIIGAEEELMAVVKVTKLRPKFSIAKILMQTGSLSRGDVANRLSKKGQKSASKMIKNCQKAIKRMDKSCKKDGSKCDKATDKKLNACTLK
jgi:curli biogenesis system outer membrane secretion channel CsgG